METAARAVGISPATYYSWMNKGRDGAKKRDAGEQLEDPQVQFLEFHDAVAKARVEAQVPLLEQIRAAARPHVQHRIVRTIRQVLEEGRPVLGADGEPITTETIMIEETEVSDWRAALGLLRHLDRRDHFAGAAKETDADVDAIVVTETELRLAESIKVGRS